MTQKYEECDKCKRWHYSDGIYCDGCHKDIYSSKGAKFTVYPSNTEDDDPKHACSVECLPAAIKEAGFERGASYQCRIEYDGPPNYLLYKLGIDFTK